MRPIRPTLPKFTVLVMRPGESPFVLTLDDTADSGPLHGVDEMNKLAEALASKFEELSLIHDLSERLKLEEDPSSVCVALLDQLAPCIGAGTLAIELFADDDAEFSCETHQAGENLDPGRIRRIADAAVRQWEELGESHTAGSVVVINRLADPDPSTSDALVQLRVVLVPIERHATRLGYMIAIRGLATEEFGTVEADLMRSTTMMLAVHLINQRQYLEMQQMFEGTVHSLVSALDAKDAYTCGHSSRVAELAVELATRLGYDEESIATIRMAGILHDIGKIGVEDSVLRKPGRLTDAEFAQIKTHPVLGYEILKGVKPFRKILPAVRHHHESWDGTGYPDGLAGDSIPRDAQVIAVADAFDAMTSNRPYRPGLPIPQVIEIFREGRGRQWASDVVDTLLQCENWIQEAIDVVPSEPPQQ